MPTVRIPQPGVAGMVTNRPPHMLAAQEAVYIQDAHLINGVLHQRRGIQRDGTTADAAQNLESVVRWKNILTGQTQTLTTASDDAAHYIHNQSAAGTVVSGISGSSSSGWAGGEMLPRAVYRDNLVYCSQTVLYGTPYPTAFYSGCTLGQSSLAGFGSTQTSVANQALITGGTFAGTSKVGSYVSSRALNGNNQILIYPRVVEISGSTSFTVEDIRYSAAIGLGGYTQQCPHGRSFPCISVYSAGTVSVAAGVATGEGTKWNSSTASRLSTAHGDHILSKRSSDSMWVMGRCSGSTTDTGTNVSMDNVSSQVYSIVRPVSFRDVAAHRGSLFGILGAGSVYQARLYASPPDWNPSAPPGATLPWDPAGSLATDDPSYFYLDFEDIGDFNDPTVAVLSTAGPLLILKTSSVHRYDGAYPSFTQSLVDDGVGCIDMRSAISVDEGVFWADRQGVYTFTGQRVVNLMAGKLDNEWRALVNEGIEYCSAGMAPGRNLLVSVKTNSVSRTYQYALDTGAWSYVSNVIARYYNTARISGEIDALFFVDDNDQGRVLDLAPAYTNVKVTDRDAQTVATADATDDYGAGSAGPPNLKYHSPANLSGDTDTEARMVTVTIRCNLRDSATPTTVLTPYHVASGGLGRGASESTKTLATITADTTDLTDRYQLDVNRTGRTHQIKCEITTLDSTDNSKVELQEIICDFRQSRKGS